jgi:hypothetical protein
LAKLIEKRGKTEKIAHMMQDRWKESERDEEIRLSAMTSA